jgi:hypothetical protein
VGSGRAREGECAEEKVCENIRSLGCGCGSIGVRGDEGIKFGSCAEGVIAGGCGGDKGDDVSEEMERGSTD